ncbi:MAG: bifunctional phosphoribosylaminoimidazolecarboxamide formyltransferase/IMP cyclohydrolase [Candidatus Omnitrophica bacterium]|nr:bifunctional phosphoribosylaminoimidazolecarboxamide formyltransferase/IMP cyclohydrolase [Candidatus Omnitrophota bacterium]MBU1128425.1 bifunctional phosphoribosylaminoimidazolecarboxamide formyltransferase/IMP cyclohydrolase [Candidatus Omnitrophota bacterium]MBU1784975.1 bifunctional phosphoribosylaminoimidazolecarboxamide formyltransferase/IMP cyclohydrolase [Candidatus Omnitrophota bacterium]MBU1851796.1 bifunctional phosphoribosylaminoimidazolecarboxamide formyltransferase/IMP cyclohyd
MKVKRALISVSDKTGLETFARGLHGLGVEIISTGGTASLIGSWDIPVVEISSYTGYPEMLDGRVKTLHPKIHAGILAVRDNDSHMREMKEKDIPCIDMVVVNLYPFEKTISAPGATAEDAIENIDIGGPSMLRSAAKNSDSVAVVSSTSQYAEILDEMRRSDGCISPETARKLAVYVFRKTAGYDSAISEYLSGHFSSGERRGKTSEMLDIRLKKIYDLRYGENPHQQAAFYRDTASVIAGVADAVQLAGKQLSFNNILDIDSAMRMVMGFDRPAVAIVKHSNPCGVAAADTLEKAYVDALDCDRLSAFGGIMAFNGAIDEKTAELILNESDFIECIIASEYEGGALDAFKRKKNLRILQLPVIKDIPLSEKDMRKVLGGMLVQDIDSKKSLSEDQKVITTEKPSEKMMGSLLFAWEVVRHVKSNAILLCRGTRTVGIGAGQMSRVDSVITAVRKAGKRAKGAVLASDAFFPVPDSIEEAHKAGISCIIQPGGSIRDADVIAACDKFRIPMVFTGIRHFRH